MPTRVEETPEYLRAQVDYEVALKQAGSDELERTKALLDWTVKSNELRLAISARNEQERTIEVAREQIKAQYPGVVEAVYANQSTAEGMLAAAKAFDEAVQAAKGPAAPAPSSAPSGYVPTGLGEIPTGQNDIEAKLRELAPQLKRGPAAARENEQFQDIMINGIIAQAVSNAGSKGR